MKTLAFTLASLLIVPAILIHLDPRSGAHAQQSVTDDADSPIRVDVDVVNLYCAVRNKQNGLVSNLEKGDFTLAEDSAPQTIKYFTRETELPLTVGLLVDVSNSQQNLIEPERRAASAFFSTVLKKKDVAFLISFGADSELLQDVTASPRVLQDGLNRLKLNGGFSGINSGPVPTMTHPRGTVLYDAVYLAANDMLSKEVGRKAIVLITDGEDQGSRETENAAIEAAQKADAIIYGILYVDRQFYNQGGFSVGGYSGEGVLKKMSEDTGGRLFKVDRKNTLDSIFDQIQQEMRTQYAIGYTPTNGKKDGSFRKIDLRVANKDMKVQVRKGYYAMPQQQ
jgi:VWFA-related protein